MCRIKSVQTTDQYLKFELVSLWQKVASSHQALDHFVDVVVDVSVCARGLVQCFRPVDGLAEGEAACW